MNPLSVLFLLSILLAAFLYWNRRLYREIAQRRKLEHELLKTQACYHALFEKSSEGVILHDLHGTVVDANKVALDMFGYPLDEIIGMHPRDLVASHEAHRVASGFEAILRDELSEIQYHCRHRSGREFLAVVRGRLVADNLIQGILREVTLERQQQQQLEKLQQQAELASKAKTRFLAHMSHEIRTPLNAIIGFSQLLSREPALPLAQQNWLDVINRSGKDLLVIINDVLEICRIEAGHITPHEGHFSLYEILADLEHIFRPRCDAVGLTLKIERQVSVPEFGYGDGLKVKQVLMNLLSNALKFTHQGGIVVRVEGPLPSAAQPGAADTIGLRFQVWDSGIGISQADQARLFQPFEQVHSDPQHTRGAGLGLVISREYVRLMGGDFVLTSAPGQGSCFQFTVIMRRGSMPQVPPEPLPVACAAFGDTPARVLIVDDDPNTHWLLEELLKDSGFEIHKAFDGQQALDVFEAVEPHLVLMDLRMPIMDGYEATRRIKNSFKGRHTPVIVITADVFSKDGPAIQAAGAAACLHKPINSAELYQVIGQFLMQPVVPGLTAEKPPEITSEAVAALPEITRSALRQALKEGNMVHFCAILKELEDAPAAVVTHLQRLALEFDYRVLETLLAGKGHTHDT